MSVQLRAKLQDVKKHLDDASQRRKEVDFALKYTRKQLDEIQRQDAAIAALSRILEDVRRLEQQDSTQLLWGESCSPREAEEKRRRLEVSLRDYDTRVSTTQHRIRTLLDERNKLDAAIERLATAQEQLSEELAMADEPTARFELKQAFSSEMVLPWANKRTDAMRLRAIMASAVIIALLLTVLVPQWEVPEPERIETIEIPERLATLIVKKPPPPPPPEPPKPEEAPEQAEAEPEAEPAPEPEEKSEARKTAEKAGLLAFKQDFSAMMGASDDIKLGSQAEIVTQGAPQRRRPAARSMITSNVEFSGTGTATAANVARKDVIGDENKLKKVEFTHIEDPQVAALDTRQLENNTPSATRRSDEEIQVVFDRYKDTLYRIYNRELRKDSFLKGKLVLQLTIEPDGSVSSCNVKSSELNSEALEQKIVARVMRFNFGPKKDAKPLTILYPINFLPAT